MLVLYYGFASWRVGNNAYMKLPVHTTSACTSLVEAWFCLPHAVSIEVLRTY